jgi:2-iminoacetate synthase ThiH
MEVSMLGVIIGVILLLLLIGLVVLQAAIEWGGFDTGKIIKEEEKKPEKSKKVIVKGVKKINRKGKK